MKNLFIILAFQICFISNIQAQSFPKSVSPTSGQPACLSFGPERPDVPDFLNCGGISYCFKSQSYSGLCGRVFCQAKFCDNSQDCKDDNDAKTVACYNKMIAASNSKVKFTKGAEIPVGTTK